MIIAPISRGAMPLFSGDPRKCCSIGVPMGSFPVFTVSGSQSASDILDLLGNVVGSLTPQVSTVTAPNGDTEEFTTFTGSTSYRGVVFAEIAGCFTPLIDLNCDLGWCINFGLTCDNPDLGPAGLQNSIPIDEANTIAISPEILSNNVQNGFGQSKPLFSKKRSLQTIDIFSSIGFVDQLQYLCLYDYVNIVDKEGNKVFEIEPESITVTAAGDASQCCFIANLTFATNDSWLCKSSCACSAYDGTFETDCEDNTNEPTECDLWTVECEDNDGVLTLNIGSPPAGQPTITWTYNGPGSNNGFLGSANSINTNNQPGSYTATVKFPGCDPKSATCIIMDPCATFSVEVAVAGCKIDSVENNVPAGETVMYEVCDSEGTVVSTSLPYTAPEDSDSQTYLVKWTAGPCSGLMPVFVAKDTNCEHSVSVTKDADNNLTGQIDNCPDGASVQGVWEGITTSGSNVFQQVATGFAFTPTETGSYRFTGVCDGCSISTEPILCIIEDEKLKIEICPNEFTDTLIQAINGISISVPAPNITIINNVDVCCDEDCDCGCNCTYNLQCIANDVNDASQGATLTIIPTGGCDGVTFTVTDPNGQVLGTGLSFQLNTKGIHTISISGEDCTGSSEYDFCLPDAGQVVAGPILLPVEDV